MATEMNSDKLKLFELLKADEAAGTIQFEHRRMLIMDADAMGLLRKELIKTVGIGRARRILTRFGYACGYRDALTRPVTDECSGRKSHHGRGLCDGYDRRSETARPHPSTLHGWLLRGDYRKSQRHECTCHTDQCVFVF
jgi:hypothetical protein